MFKSFFSILALSLFLANTSHGQPVELVPGPNGKSLMIFKLNTGQAVDISFLGMFQSRQQSVFLCLTEASEPDDLFHEEVFGGVLLRPSASLFLKVDPNYRDADGYAMASDYVQITCLAD